VPGARIDDRIRAARLARAARRKAKEKAMAVQQNKKSPSKRGMHRAHDFITPQALATEPVSGETHRRHHISPSGYYRGKKVVKTKADE
jgi:large subunit ribosomal protein L32